MVKFYSIVVFFLLSVLGSSLQAQTDELKVDNFYNDPTYAIKVRTETVEDGNGKPCGLVVVRIAVPDAKIEGSYIVKAEKHENEWYVWMAEEASYIVIKSSDYLPLEYHFPEALKSKSAYVMIVKKPDVVMYAFSQELTVVDFHRDHERLDAIREPVKDLNGTVCGLVRLGLVHSDVVFEGDILKTEYRNCEWYVWMAEGARFIVIKASGYTPLHYDFSKPISSKATYIMTITKSNDDWNKINAFSYIVPGLGQIELGNKTEGYAIIAGEIMLLSGGVISSVAANKQLGVMRDADVSLGDYLTAKSNYNTQKVVNVTCYIGAAVLYGLHLYRVYHLSKNERESRYASLSPAILSSDGSMIYGLSLNIKM